MRNIPYVAVSAVFLSATPALAEEAAGDPRPEITVVASGMEEPVDEVGQAVSVVSRDEIDAVQGPDLTRVLQRLPGIAISRSGGPGGQTGVLVRGANSYQTLVLVDGVRVSDPSTPQSGYDFSNLTLGTIEKIELLRGSNSVVWGSQAIGGVVAVTTRQLEGVETSVEHGAYDSWNANAAAGLTSGGFSGTVAGGYTRSDGFSAMRGGIEPDGYQQWNVSGKARYAFGNGFEVFAAARHMKSRIDLDFTAVGDDQPVALDTQRTRETSARVGLDYRAEPLELTAAFSLLDTHRLYDNPVFGSFEYFGRSERIEFDGRWVIIPELALVFGAEHEWSRYDGTFDPRRTATLTSGHALIDFASGPLRLSGGVRIDAHDRFGAEWSLGASGRVELGGGWRVRASYGEGFRAPTLYELYGFAGDPTLRPETSSSYDAGVEYGDRNGVFHLGATAFRRDSRNLIEFALPFGPYYNVGRARAQGVELEAAARLGDRLWVRAAYTYLETENRTPGDANRGDELPRRPRHTVALSADWRTPLRGLALGADLRMVGDRFDLTDNVARLDGFVTLDLRASLPVTDRLELFGRIENVADEQYETSGGFNTPGRSAYGGVRARF